MSKRKKTASVNFFEDTSSSNRTYIQWIGQNNHQFLIIVFTFIGFIYRLVFAMNTQGILHADEIFQGLEIGHKIAFGSGVIAPEFQNENPNTPSYAASRSWTFPLIFGIIMRFFDLLGFDYFKVTLPTIRLLLAVNSTLLIVSSRKLAGQITKNQNVELFTTVFLAVWYRIVDFTIRSFTNTFFLPILFYAIYRVLINLEMDRISRRDHFIVIFGFGIATYNRLDLIVIILAFFIVTVNAKKMKLYLHYVINTAIGWMIGLVVDFYYYEKFVIPPLNWVRFNLIEYNSDAFSINSWNFYIQNLIILDGLKPFVILTGLLLFMTVFIRIYNPKSLDPENEILIIGYYHLFLATSFIWIVYTSFWRNINLENIINFITKSEGWGSHTHKEPRFIMGGLVVMLIYISTGLEIGIMLFTRFLQWIVIDMRKIKDSKFLSSEIKHWTNLVLPILLIILITFQSVSYANHRQYVESYGEINIGLEYVGVQNDTTGVIVGVSWYQSGGYTYSHLNSDVSLVFVNFEETDTVKLEVTKKTAANYLQNEIYNYFIVPDYQFQWNEDLLSQLFEFGWKLLKIIDGIVEIWKRT